MIKSITKMYRGAESRNLSIFNKPKVKIKHETFLPFEVPLFPFQRNFTFNQI